MEKELFTRKQMENAVMLAGDLYQRLYNESSIKGCTLDVVQVIIHEAVKMEEWIVENYGHDDEDYLSRVEEYEAMLVAKYDLRLPEVTEPEELEFYSIEDDGKGGKRIHVLGYCYKGEDNGNGEWRNVEYTGFIEPLQEFIEHLKQNEDYVDNTAADLNQYIGDHTDDGMTDIINHYFCGRTANAELHYSEITMDTPCGDYVC